MTETERAIRYIQQAGGAISGSGGHNHTFALACNLFKNFSLPQNEIHNLLEQHHNPVCDPPWSEKELRHKVEEAAKATGGPSPKPVATAPVASRPAVKKFKGIRHTYMAGTTRPLPEEMEDGARKLLRHCFREGEGVRIVHPDLNEQGKEVPDQGLCFSREFWLEKLDSRNGKVNDPGGFLTKPDNPGIYIGINPLKEGETLDKHVTDYRHALLEFDELDIKKQWELCRDSEIPIAALIHSGKRSLHAWVKVDAKDRKEYDERVAAIYEYFADHNPDTKNKNPGRLSRMPNCVRMDSRQKLLALDLGKASFSEWLADIELDDIGDPLDIEQLLTFNPKADPNQLIGERRWICKGATCVWIGPSGVGKSTLTMQAAITWALGRSFFGMAPKKPLRSLIIQAENDEGDIAEMVQGVLTGMGIDLFDDEIDLIKSNVLPIQDCSHTGPKFAQIMLRLINRYQPDLVWIDPLLSFIGGDISKQEVCSEFFRKTLNPILHSTGVALMCIHHTGKPPKERQNNRSSSDYAYDGLGSSDLTNWTRAVCTLVSHGGSGKTFELKLPKRGGRTGAKDMSGQPTESIWLTHSDKGLNWVQIEKPEWAEKENRSRKSEGKQGSRGAPKTELDLEKFLRSIAKEPLSIPEIKKRASEFAGCSVKTIANNFIEPIKAKMETKDGKTFVHIPELF